MIVDLNSSLSLILTAAKNSQTILMKSCRQKHIKKIFDGIISLKSLPTTLLQIFNKIILNPKVIVLRVYDPDNNVKRVASSINTRHCPLLPAVQDPPMVLLQRKDPLELFVKSREFLSRFWVSISS